MIVTSLRKAKEIYSKNATANIMFKKGERFIMAGCLADVNNFIKEYKKRIELDELIHNIKLKYEVKYVLKTVKAQNNLSGTGRVYLNKSFVGKEVLVIEL